MELVYDMETIRKALALLNSIEVRGIENAQRLAAIAAMLNNPKEEKDGKIQES